MDMSKTEIRELVGEVLKTQRIDKEKTAMENWVAFISRLDMHGRRKIWGSDINSKAGGEGHD